MPSPHPRAPRKPTQVFGLNEEERKELIGELHELTDEEKADLLKNWNTIPTQTLQKRPPSLEEMETDLKK